MAPFFGRAIAAILEMDHIDTKKDYPAPGKTTYTFITTGVSKNIQELKAKILSMLDWPVDIPEDVKVSMVKKGRVFKEYLVDIVVDSGKIGKVENLIARKYGLRKRPYR